MGPKRASRAEKGKGKAVDDEPPRRRTRSGSVVIREPTDEVPREEPREETREEPRKSKSRKSNAKKKRDEPAVVREVDAPAVVREGDAPEVVREGEDYDFVYDSYDEEELAPAPRGFTFPQRANGTPLERDPKKQPSPRELYDALMEITFVPSRFPDPDTLKKLGIYDEVKEILRNMGLEWVLRREKIAYKEETCQFLATLSLASTSNGITCTFKGNDESTYGGPLEIWARILGIP
ncbi:unnamed protein product [Cochlearia groenlandica]